MKQFTISKNDSGQRVDKFLTKATPNMPQSYMYRMFRKKRIKLNGKRAEISDFLNEGDVLELYINDEFFAENMGEKYEFLNAPKTLNILYEDENIILTDKKQGILSHDGDNGDNDENTDFDTQINRIKRYLYDKKEYEPENENSFAPALCNRIDRNTGGIVIAAKNAESLRILNEKIKLREVEKKYLCICVGKPPKAHDILTAYIQKDSKLNKVTVCHRKTPQNKTAVTEYNLLNGDVKGDGRLSLLEITLHTGRTHQIRAVMAYLGCPLLGDGKYGVNKINKEYGFDKQALYSYKLKFDFKTDSRILDYLNGQEFAVKDIWFLQ